LGVVTPTIAAFSYLGFDGISTLAEDAYPPTPH
jgi:amino acid transporter